MPITTTEHFKKRNHINFFFLRIGSFPATSGAWEGGGADPELCVCLPHRMRRSFRVEASMPTMTEELSSRNF